VFATAAIGQWRPERVTLKSSREVLAPFAAVRVPYDFAADDEPVSLPIPGGAYRAANTLFNKLKEKDNAGN